MARALTLVAFCGVSLVFGFDRIVHHVYFALANLKTCQTQNAPNLKNLGSTAKGGALRLREHFHTKRLARGHDRPYDPGKFVGERHRDEPRGPAREKRDDPLTQRPFAFADHFQQMSSLLPPKAA